MTPLPDIRTDRLDLVPLSLDFVEAVLAGDRERAAGVLGATLDGWPEGVELERAFPVYRATLARDAAAAPWHGRAIVLREGRRAVGSVNLKGPPDASGGVEVGYGVAEPYRRRGYASEAAEAVVAWAFGRPEVRRVVAAIVPSNEPSVRLARSLGFRETGQPVPRYGEGEELWVLERERWEARRVAEAGRRAGHGEG